VRALILCRRVIVPGSGRGDEFYFFLHHRCLFKPLRPSRGYRRELDRYRVYRQYAAPSC
jgi:hypothetical protein